MSCLCFKKKKTAVRFLESSTNNDWIACYILFRLYFIPMRRLLRCLKTIRHYLWTLNRFVVSLCQCCFPPPEKLHSYLHLYVHDISIELRNFHFFPSELK